MNKKALNVVECVADQVGESFPAGAGDAPPAGVA
jgi:hypothetical protein